MRRIIDSIENRTKTHIFSKKGWTTDRKIIVIESDDWGSIRMPSIDTLNYLQSKGVKLNPQLGYDKYDTLASNTDLEMLFEVLCSVKDVNGNPAKMTFNAVMTNPDFDKIKESKYTEYRYELFTNTLKRYPNHDKVFLLWLEGINKNLIKPQFHAREHLNVQLWLKALRENWNGVRLSFEKKVFCNYFDKKLDSRGRFLETYNIAELMEYDFILESIEDGLDLFQKLFSFKSKSMIAPNYMWDNRIEEFTTEHGVRFLQGGIVQRNTLVSTAQNRKKNYFHYMGENNKYGQIYLTRNCIFEPSQNKKYNADYCLKNIENAFKHNKPAVICSHRLNYIGGLDKSNRDNTLIDFSFLLKDIVKKYPNIEFMSSDELGEVISNE